MVNNYIMGPGDRNAPKFKEQIIRLCPPFPGKDFISWRRGRTISLGEIYSRKLQENITWQNNPKIGQLKASQGDFPRKYLRHHLETKNIT